MALSSLETLRLRLEEYKRKYYLNLLLKGVLFSAAVLLSAYLLLNTLEYFGRFGSTFRMVLFFAFLATLIFSLTFWVIKPAWFLYGRRKPLTDEQAAQQIGQHFPEVGDRLLNTLQLSRIDARQNELLLASIQQKSQQLSFVRFADAVHLDENQRYIKYVALPALLIVLILFVSPAFFVQPTTRIVNFKNEYAEEAPFTFLLENESLRAFKNEDFTVRLTLDGGALPEGVILRHGNRDFRMEPTGNGQYTYTFHKVQKNLEFGFEAVGFRSDSYELKVLQRPALAAFQVRLQYPAYLNKPAEELANVGNLNVPQGTSVTWLFDAPQTESVSVTFDPKSPAQPAERARAAQFSFSKRLMQSSPYRVELRNAQATNREPIQYFISVIPDKYPTITLEPYRDSTLYNYLVLTGALTDDYGLSRLQVFYKVTRQGQPAPPQFASVSLPVQRAQTIQNYYYPWQTDSLRLEPGDRLEYYVQVWDNDGVNGAKSARTPVQDYAPPSRQAVERELEEATEKAEAQLDKSISRAQQLKSELAALENRLRSKRDLDFQDRKQVEELLKKRAELMEEIRQIQEQNKQLNQQQQRFNQVSPEAQQKAEQLQKLMEELLNNDTEKLYEQLKNMLEKSQDNRMLELLERIKNKERNTEKELDRALNLFKKLQVDQKVNQAIDELKKLAEAQQKLAEKTEKTDPAATPEKQEEKLPQTDQLQQEQEALEKAMDDIKKKLEEAEKMNEELSSPQEMDMQKDQQEQISDQQKQSKQDLSKKNTKGASQKQQKASKQMKQLAESLEQMQESAEMQEASENMDDLRKILENLLRLSFDQERVMKDFRGVNLSDPRFVKLSQEQLKLQDDARIVEDSLYALAKRVLQIESFVTRELNDMRRHMDEGTEFIKNRRIPQATSKQQFAMTSMNNLALMLSDVLKQMQESMANMMAMSGSKSGKKKGQAQPKPGLGQQQQQLNEQMQQMQQQGGNGRAQSEQLARMAAEQAALRKQLQELMDQVKGTQAGQQAGKELQELMKKMDQTEEDLVNKRLSQNTINRNKELVTRLLESEKALKEQEEEQKRKAETARQVPPRTPPALDTFVRERQRQTELLRTVPPSLSPFYRREVDQYFQKIK
jgi:hypothetical protein